MASFTRRFRILKHLLAAVEHQNAAMQLMLEDPDLDAPLAAESPAERAERRKRLTEQPTIMHPAFNSQMALDELERAHADAKSPQDRSRVAEMAHKLVQSGLCDAESVKKFA